MNKPTPTFRKLTSAFALILICLCISTGSAAVISVNLANQGGAAYIVGGGTNYGIASQGTYVSGWLNLNNTASAQKLPFSDGTASSIGMFGTVVGSGNFNSYNPAYAYTPLYAGYTVYNGAGNTNTITLTNLTANFPSGYKVIVYLSGYLQSSGLNGGSISDGSVTYYFKPYATAASIPNPLTPTQVTSTTPGSYQLGQYVVFGDSTLLTSDTLSLTIRALQNTGDGLCGIQLVGASASEIFGRTWVGNVNNSWDNSSQNWTNYLGAGTNFADGNLVFFTDAAVASSPTVNLTSAWQPGAVTVNSTKNYTFTGSGIAGTTEFTQAGAGITTLNNANTYTGNTTISAGTLKIGNPAAIPSGAGAGNVSVASGATLDLNGVSGGVNGLTGSGTVTDTGAPATLTIGLNNDATTFAGSFQGAAGLKKQGTNTITLTGSSSHSGATTVAQGTLVLSPLSSYSGSSALVVSNGATLSLSVTNGAGLFTSADVSLNGGVALSIDYGNAAASGYPTPVSSSGALNLNGVSQIAIVGNSFAVGDYTLISYGSKTGTGSISSTPASLPTAMVATIQDTGSAIVLHVTSPSVQTLYYTYGDGGVWATNAAADYWNLGAAVYTEYPSGLGDDVIFGTKYNSFNLSGGTVSVNTDVHPASILVSGNYKFTGPGKITGATGVQMTGAVGSTFVLDNVNAYTGVTTISSGTLQINNGSALGSAAGATVVASGASLALSNSMILSGEPLTLNGNGTSGNNGALRTLDPVNAVTVSGPITLGSNARIAAGPSGSQLIITAPVTDNGSNFTLFVQVPGASSTVLLNSSGNVAGNLQVFGSTVRFGVNNTFPSSSLSTGSGLFDLNGTTQTFAGLQQGSTPNNGVITNSSALAATLDINYSGTNSAAFASAISGAVNVVKDGTGAQSFGGGTSVTNTYSGTTTVNAGILGLATDMSRVTNSFIVNNGGTLRGITTIGGSVTVNSGGTIYAGYASNSIGTLTINNGLSLAGNTIIAVNKDVSPSNDVINVSGPLQYGGTLTVYNLGTNALVAGDTFTVFPPGGTGTVSIQSEPGVTFSFSDGVLTVASVTAPEPPSLNYTALGSGVFQFNWTGAYKLQWQTNALSIGLGSNWVDYPDTSNPVNVTNNPAIPASFFRLISL